MSHAGKLQSIMQLVRRIQKDQRKGPAGPYSISQPDGPSRERYPQLGTHRDALLALGNAEVLAGQADLPAGDSHSSGVTLDLKMIWNGLMMDRNLVLMKWACLNEPGEGYFGGNWRWLVSGFISSALPIRRCCELWVLESHCSLVTAFVSRGTGSVSSVPAIQPGQTEKVNKNNPDPGCRLAPKPLCKWLVSEQTWLLVGIPHHTNVHYWAAQTGKVLPAGNVFPARLWGTV